MSGPDEIRLIVEAAATFGGTRLGQVAEVACSKFLRDSGIAHEVDELAHSLMPVKYMSAEDLPEVSFVHDSLITWDSEVGACTIVESNVRIGDERGGAIVGKDVVIGEGSCLDHLATVKNGAQIGPNVRLEQYSSVGAGALIGPGTSLGRYARVQAGAVIGTNCRIGAGRTVWAGDRLPADSVLPDLSVQIWDQNQLFHRSP